MGINPAWEVSRPAGAGAGYPTSRFRVPHGYPVKQPLRHRGTLPPDRILQERKDFREAESKDYICNNTMLRA